MLGVAWACWHLPLYAIAAGGQERAPLAAFLISVVALSVLYTWFWTVTSGSLVVALLLHSSTNAAAVILLRDARSDFGPSILATFLTVSLAVAAARNLRAVGALSPSPDIPIFDRTTSPKDRWAPGLWEQTEGERLTGKTFWSATFAFMTFREVRTGT